MKEISKHDGYSDGGKQRDVIYTWYMLLTLEMRVTESLGEKSVDSRSSCSSWSPWNIIWMEETWSTKQIEGRWNKSTDEMMPCIQDLMNNSYRSSALTPKFWICSKLLKLFQKYFHEGFRPGFSIASQLPPSPTPLPSTHPNSGQQRKKSIQCFNNMANNLAVIGVPNRTVICWWYFRLWSLAWGLLIFQFILIN